MPRINFEENPILLQDALRGEIPREFSDNIITETIRGSAVMQLATEEEMDKPVKEFTYMSGIGAHWTNEAEVIETEAPKFINAEMRAYKMAVIIPATREHLLYAVPEFFEKMQPKIAKAFHEKFDQAALVGVRSPWNRSVLSVAAKANNLVTETTDKYDDVNKAMGKVEEKDFEPNGLATIKAQKVKYRGTRDANGQPIFNQAKKGEVDDILGLPISYAPRHSFAKKAVELIGDWNFAFFGILDDINYEILTEATLSTIVDEYGKPINLAERDMIAIRATMSVAWFVASDDAFSAVVPEGMGVEPATEAFGREVPMRGIQKVLKAQATTAKSERVEFIELNIDDLTIDDFAGANTDELKAALSAKDINFKGVKKRDDLMTLLAEALGDEDTSKGDAPKED